MKEIAEIFLTIFLHTPNSRCTCQITFFSRGERRNCQSQRGWAGSLEDKSHSPAIFDLFSSCPVSDFKGGRTDKSGYKKKIVNEV